MSETPTTLDPSQFDLSVDPGSDFYRYANGRWLDANPIPPEYGAWGSFHEVHTRNEALLHGLLEDAVTEPASEDDAVRMVGNYYASGMDTDAIEGAGIEPLRHLFDQIAAVTTVADWRALAVELHQMGVGVFFGSYVAPDFEDSDRYLLWIRHGGMGLPERDYYMRDDERSLELRGLYEAHIGTQLESAGSEDAASDAAAILSFETALAEVSYTAVQARDVDLTVNRHSMGELGSLMPAFDLPSYLVSMGMGGLASVNVDNPGFFEALDELLAATDVTTLKAYCRWTLIRATAGALPAIFADEAFEFYGKKLGGQQAQKDRWKRVLAAANHDIGELVAQLYVRTAFSHEAKDRCETLVGHLLSAMEASIKGLEWMTDETKSKALKKLSSFSYKIGYPDAWRDYGMLVIDRGPFVLNRLRASRFEFERKRAQLGGPVDRTEWLMGPHEVNAYYYPLGNEIVFPAGILQPPFFYADADDALNYGAIGSIIGHEITHGFDDKGSRFDGDGHLENWWTDHDREEFERRAAMVVEQFNAYEAAEDLTVNGELTLGENIADLGGLRISLAAFEEALAEDGESPEVDGLTPHQRFFLSYATAWRQNSSEEWLRLIVQSDTHSPNPFRCNGPLGSLAEFAAAFGLDEDSPIVRPVEERIAIW